MINSTPDSFKRSSALQGLVKPGPSSSLLPVKVSQPLSKPLGTDKVQMSNVLAKFEDLSHIGQAVAKAGKHAFTNGNHFEFHPDGNNYLPAILKTIDSAQKEVLLNVYAIFNDEIGNMIVNKHLAPLVKKGVTVKFIVDGPANMKHRALLESAKAQGIDLIEYTDGYGKLGALNPINVDHQKYVVVDGKIAVGGGANFGKPYLTEDHPFWHDGGTSFSGPVVKHLREAFGADWKKSGGTPFTQLEPDLKPVGTMRATIALTGPHDHEIKDTTFAAIDAAREHINYQTPYLTNQELIDHLSQAALNGVEVHVQIPTVGDNPACDILNDEASVKLIAAGVHVHRYDSSNIDANPLDPKTLEVMHNHETDHFPHFKVATFDYLTTIVGSANGDDRSLLHNEEVNFIVDDANYTKSVNNMFDNDFATRSPELKKMVMSLKEKLADAVIGLGRIEF